jgi:anaerobic magnesium-protoporphyrin IX monomethyl ester cyclase
MTIGGKKIDCFLVGHNEIGVSRHNQLLRLLYGKSSRNYQETEKYNLSHIRCEDGHYSPSQIFNMVQHQDGANAEIADTFPLTIAYLGSYLHRNGFTFQYINGFHRERDRAKLAHYLERGEVATVAITTTYYLTPIPVLDIVRFVRSYDKDVKIVVGGPFIHNQVKHLPDDKLQWLLGTIGADYYVSSNEGEATLGGLLSALKQGTSPRGTDNVWVKEGGRYVSGQLVPEVNDLNANPVEWSLFAEDIKDIVNIRTSKSCPFKCSFCSFPGAAGRYKVTDLSVVEHELDALHAINPDLGLDIIDDTFNIPKPRFESLLKLMIRKKYRFRWYAFYKAQLAEREITRLMKDAGCVQVFAGCESGSQVILDNLVKQSTVEKYHEAFEYLHEFGLLSIASFIVGFPGETDETYRQTLEFIQKAQPTFFRARLWWYDRTAPVHEERERFRLTGDGYEWQHYTMGSGTAQKLADELILSVRNSIHATDYPIPFEMIVKGVPVDTVKAFMSRFRDYLHRSLTDPSRAQLFDREEVRRDFARVLGGEAWRPSTAC